MREYIQILIDVQDKVIECRRLASEVVDPETSRRLYELADEVEQRAREIDAL
jgi:hypothetical protein